MVINASDGAPKVCAKLLDQGFHIAGDRSSIKSVMRLLLRWKCSKRLVLTDRLGWSSPACTSFVLGNGRILGNPEVVFRNDQAREMAGDLVQKGDIAEWRSSVSAVCLGNPLLILGVSMAFSGPLLEVVGAEGGGLHLRGESSRGKTTIQRAAVSVWGSPDALKSWRATANGLEGIASASNSSLLALDELGEADGNQAFEAFYMLSNGKGKQRANQAGQARGVAKWRVAVISSGEITFAAKVAEMGRKAKAGQEVRILVNGRVKVSQRAAQNVATLGLE
jgi:putative DNA primase/helicase